MISICFILLLLISILTSSYGQVTCPSGWIEYGGSCYKVRVLYLGVYGYTWDQCNAYCSTSYPGATMLCVNNAAENAWMRTQYGGFMYWIGYTGAYQNQQKRWGKLFLPAGKVWFTRG